MLNNESLEAALQSIGDVLLAKTEDGILLGSYPSDGSITWIGGLTVSGRLVDVRIEELLSTSDLAELSLETSFFSFFDAELTLAGSNMLPVSMVCGSEQSLSKALSPLMLTSICPSEAVLLRLPSIISGFEFECLLLPLPSIASRFEFEWLLLPLPSIASRFEFECLLLPLPSITSRLEFECLLLPLPSITSRFEFECLLLPLPLGDAGLVFTSLSFSLQSTGSIDISKCLPLPFPSINPALVSESLELSAPCSGYITEITRFKAVAEGPSSSSIFFKPSNIPYFQASRIGNADSVTNNNPNQFKVRKKYIAMEEARGHSLSSIPESALFNDNGQSSIFSLNSNHGSSISGLKKRGHGSRSWIKIDQDGNSQIVTLDKATIMRDCSLPSRDLRLLDPMFIYPSTILGREKAIVVNLEQIRCIITADEVILMNSLDDSVGQYKSELSNRLQREKSDDLPFEFWALELALELTCTSLDAQVSELEMEIYPVLDELATSISTLNLERVRKFKGHLLALTQRVQKVRDEIEQLMDDDGDMAEMCLTEKKRRSDTNPLSDLRLQTHMSGSGRIISKSAPSSPERSISGVQMLQRAFSSIGNSSKHESLTSSSDNVEKIEPLEMLLEAYFVVIDNTLTKSLSLKEYIDDTEDLINIKLGNIQNELIQFELLLTAATLVASVFATVTGVFGMNFETTVFEYPSGFNLVLIISAIACAVLYFFFLLCFRHKKVLPA
ncbi:Magnesium transporter MRS2-5 [Senna tora]|uniref:Magnesium transporter MRS2-5 n=1 Tax=Senna tora TaxID=362788 RepID=A0A834SSD1_9FABA|nr:Magnesium transporter MRS2-5 [Senna tora]